MNPADKPVLWSDGIVSAVCHGPAALVDAKLSSGEYLVKGKQSSIISFCLKVNEPLLL